MKTKIILIIIFIISSAGCGSSPFKPYIIIKRSSKIEANSRYYEGKAQSIVRQIYYDTKKYDTDITKVAVIDFIDVKGKASYLGRFLASKISFIISQGGYFSIIQNGEVNNMVGMLDIEPGESINTTYISRLGKLLSVDAIIIGNIIDIGTNIDVTVMSIDTRNGNIIASASEDVARTQFAVDLMDAF